MEVGLHGEHALEGPAEQPADDPLGHGLARLERAVLSHVGKVGRDQGHAPGAAPPQRVRGEQELDELVVGPVEGSHQHRARRYRADAHPALAVGKAVHEHPRGRRAAEGPRQPPGEREGVAECVDLAHPA